MRVLLICILALAIGLAAGILAVRALRAPAGDDAPRVACGPVILFGDSLAAGYGATLGNDPASLLAARLGVPVENQGRNGDTTSTGLMRLESAIARKPGVVIVVLGGNDFLQRRDAGAMRDNLTEIARRLRAAGAVPVLVGLQEPEGKGAYAAAYEEAAEGFESYVPDVLDGIFGKPSLMADLIHPNDAGYALVAERIAPYVRQAIDERCGG